MELWRDENWYAWLARRMVDDTMSDVLLEAYMLLDAELVWC